VPLSEVAAEAILGHIVSIGEEDPDDVALRYVAGKTAFDGLAHVIRK
jgi:hypothetical protein